MKEINYDNRRNCFIGGTNGKIYHGDRSGNDQFQGHSL